MAFVHNDDTMIGQKASHYFQSLGDFRSFLFLPAPEGTRWSEEREAGFRESLALSGCKCRSVGLAEVEECDADDKKILDASELRKSHAPCSRRGTDVPPKR
jgi:DNA-binding LacI/PurR family transcriptional regulator